MWTHAWSLLQLLVLQLFWFVLVSAEAYYATPTCPEGGVSCMTLSMYATQPSNYFTSNTTLILLPGNHSLQSELRITNITHLTISTSLPDTTVTCSQSARFSFVGVRHVSVNGIRFFGCMNSSITSVRHLTVEGCNFDGQHHEGTGMEIESVSDATVLNSFFADNNGGKMVYDPYKERTIMGGGAMIVIDSKILIAHCVFSGNSVNNNDIILFEGGTVCVLNSDVTVNNCEFINNTAGNDGCAIYVTEANAINNVSVLIGKTLFINNTAGVVNGGGGAVSVAGGRIGSVTIENSVFINNMAGVGSAVRVYGDSVTIINNSAFINNTAGYGGGAVWVGGGSISIDTSTFVKNTAGGEGGAVRVYSDRVTIDNSTFINNKADGGLGGGAVLVGFSRSVTIHNSTFINDTAHYDGGAVRVSGDSAGVTIDSSLFINNTAGYRFGGGAVRVVGDSTNVTIDNSTFINNTAGDGGAVRVGGDSTSITIDSSTLVYNTANYDGGAVRVVGDSASVALDNSMLINNTAADGVGGAMRVGGDSTSVKIDNSAFIDNTARNDCGGGIGIYQYTTVFRSPLTDNSLDCFNSTFIRNRAPDGGGICILTVNSGSSANLTDITLIHNSATRGAAIYLVNCDLSSNGYLNIDSNVASSGVVYALQSTVSLSGVTDVSNNIGSVFAFNSNVTLSGSTTFMNNSYPSNFLSEIQEGGAVTIFQSNIYLHDIMNMQFNEAENGGAILATESKIYMYGNIRIADNRALQSGGGIYAFQTELIIEHDVTVSGNTADKKGGGMYAISSNVKVSKFSLHFIDNHAEQRGGGVCLELDAKLYIIKSECETNYFVCNTYFNSWPKIVFTNNSADHGGAVYVTDDTNSGTCSATSSREQSTTIECFFQVLALYRLTNNVYQTSEVTASQLNLINLHFTNNTARLGGGMIFGGLLDRCTVSPFAEMLLKFHSLSLNSVNATSYLLNVTNVEKTFSDISSHPVRVCFCKDDQPDCDYQPPTKHVLKGTLFTVLLVAVDQVKNTVPNSIIHSSLLSGDGRLSEGQDIQQTNDSCTKLQYNAFSPNVNETMLLYAEGPCNDTGISARYIELDFVPCQCPIGFKPADEPTECACECDPALSPYITTMNCFIDDQTVLREGNFWITHVNDSDNGFIVHPHCPFDYCHPPSKQVFINFNIHNGADAQCAFNRTGILCGSCGKDLSLSLGSSRCMACSSNWIALLILFAIAGIALVVFLLVFNLTVTVGTISGLIFYANIIFANSNVFLPFDKPNFLTVFIAWLNLDFGFETCFYDGMDGYAKVWLQLVFPCYIILLVAMVIVVGEYSHRFSRLLSYRKPVATLATLILLSYTKLLRTIIVALSFTTLEYPDGSHTTVWLYDANIPYLEGKHIPLFIAAVLILLAGLVYTFLLIFWQWLIRCSSEQQVQWLMNNLPTLHTWYSRVHMYLYTFMDVYHAPYNTRHRYWTGLLLLLRVVLYLISAVNVFGDPSVNLLTISCVVVLLFIWKLIVYKIYKSEYLSNLGTLFLANLIIFTVGTLYIRAAGSGNQAALAYTSTSAVFITFLGIICYHTRGVYSLLKLKIHGCHHPMTKVEERNETVTVTVNKEHRELVPLSRIVSVTEFDGLPDPNQDSQDNEEEVENRCED